MLRPALFRDDNDPAWQVPNPDRRAGLVALLPAWSTGAIRVHGTLGQQLRITQSCPNCARFSGMEILGFKPILPGLPLRPEEQPG